MAKTRDIVIGLIIGITFLFTLVIFAFMFIGAMYGEGDVGLTGFGSKVAVVEVHEVIIESNDIVSQLKKWGSADNVKAIVIHINSPGGAVAPTQEIYNEILRIRVDEGKPIVASISSIAASGGYYIACAADYIVANPGSITGSIGVIMQFLTAEKLLDKIGVSYETVKSGELKDIGSRDRDMTEKERQMLTAMVMDTYEQFVEAVASGRGFEMDDIYPYADGSIFSGNQAYNMGLIDTLGGLEDAIRLAAELGGIEGDPTVVRVIEPKPGFFDMLGSLAGKAEDLATGQSSGPQVLYLY